MTTSLMVLFVAAYSMTALVLIAIHNQDTSDDLSPLVRDPKRGEPRWRYWISQFPRALTWFPLLLVWAVSSLPTAIRYLREPMGDRDNGG